VSLGNSNKVEVLGNAGPVLNVLRTIKVEGTAMGEALTTDGDYLVVADGAGASVISVHTAIGRGLHPVVRQLTAPGLTGAAQVAVSPNSYYAFVLYPAQNELAVFNLSSAENPGFHGKLLVRTISIPQPDSIAVWGDWLYVVSRGTQSGSGSGALSALSLPAAVQSQGSVPRHTAPAGCSPDAVITSADGTTVWVTAKDSNELLGYSAARLSKHPLTALITKVRVGPTPVGLTLINNGPYILVSDPQVSFAVPGVPGIDVVSMAKALAGQPALLGFLPHVGRPGAVVSIDHGTRLLIASYGGPDEVLLVTPTPRLP
jgi:DNA-binding beta-propeller fold protein YncE